MRLFAVMLFASSLCGQVSSSYVATGNPSPYVDGAGHFWAADSGVNCTGGTTFHTTTNVTGTADPTLYQYGRQGNNISCTANLVSGIYAITLKFADVLGFTVPGQQVFNIFVNGTMQRPNFDIFNTIRAQNVAYDVVIPFYSNLTTGNVSIQVQQVSGGAQLQAVSWVTSFSSVTSLNGQIGDVSIIAGSHMTVSAGSGVITINTANGGWFSGSLQNGWSNAASWNVARWQNEQGRIFLSGVIQGGTLTAGTVLFNIPGASNHPLTKVLLLAWGGSADTATPTPVGILVATTGDVTLDGNSLGAGQFISLEGLSFSLN